MKIPPNILLKEDLSLILWEPRGILDQATVNEIVAFIEAVEERYERPLNRFIDLSALDAVDLNFRFVFFVALGRRLSVKYKPPMKSAFYVTSPATRRYTKLHEILTRYSPLHVRLFGDRAAAAKWLNLSDTELTIS